MMRTHILNGEKEYDLKLHNLALTMHENAKNIDLEKQIQKRAKSIQNRNGQLDQIKYKTAHLRQSFEDDRLQAQIDFESHNAKAGDLNQRRIVSDKHIKAHETAMSQRQQMNARFSQLRLRVNEQQEFEEKFIRDIGYKSVCAKRPAEPANPNSSLLAYFYLDKPSRVKSTTRFQEIVIEQGTELLK